MSGQLLETDQVAEKLSVNPQTVRRLAKRGEIIAIKIGNDWRFEESDIDAFIAERKAKAIAEIKARQTKAS